MSDDRPIEIAISAVADLFIELHNKKIIKVNEVVEGAVVSGLNDRLICKQKIIDQNLDRAAELESELNEALLRNKELEDELSYISKSDNIVIDSYKLEVQELDVALEAAAEIFKNLHTYCFTLDSHWGMEINKWLQSYKKIKEGDENHKEE